MSGSTGSTFLDYAAMGGKEINISLHTGGNVTGTISGYDGVYLYVVWNSGSYSGKAVGIPVWNVEVAQITN